MDKDISAVFKDVDKLTDKINQLKNNTKNLTKDISEFRKIKDEAFEKKAEIKLDISSAKEELRELQKYAKEGTEEAEKNFVSYQKKIYELQYAHKSLNKVIKESSSMERNLTEDVSRTKNAENIKGGKSLTGKGVMSAVINSDLAKNLKNEVGAYASYQILRTQGKSQGKTTTNIAGGAITGAIDGAMLGSAIAPVIGTAIGLVGGTLVGAITGKIKDKREKQEEIDDLFRDDVKSLYEGVKAQSKQELDKGIGLAGKSEKDLIGLSTVLGGDSVAKDFMKNAQKFALKSPFETGDITEVAKKLSAYGYKSDDILDKDGNGLMKHVGNAGSALGMSKEDMKAVATSIGKINSSEKVSLDQLKPLIDRGIPAIEYLAKSKGQSEKNIYEMINKGQIDGKAAVKVISEYMNKSYAGGMDKESKTYEGMKSRLEKQQASYDESKGQGYIKERKNGMEGQVRFHNANGKDIKKSNEALGAFQARLDNLRDEKVNLAINDMLKNNKSYKKAVQSNDLAKQGEEMQRARVRGMLDFRRTEEFKLQQQADLLLVQGIQEDASIQEGYYKAGQEFGNAMSKGIMDSVSKKVATMPNWFDKYILRKDNDENSTGGTGYTGPKQDISPIISPIMDRINPKKNDTEYNGILNGYGKGVDNSLPKIEVLRKGHAVGLERVPYDNYPAILHEGERVLTKAQVNTVPLGNGIVINMNNTVRDDSDIDKIAQALVSQLSRHQSSFGGEY